MQVATLDKVTGHERRWTKSVGSSDALAGRADQFRRWIITVPVGAEWCELGATRRQNM
jgi:hypothetical protein